MKNVAKKIIKYFVSAGHTVYKSRMVQRLLDECPAKVEKPYKIFGHFSDSRGNIFDLYEGVRDTINPGWQAMLKPLQGFHPMPAAVLDESSDINRVHVERLLRVLQCYSFNIRNKVVLEIGCFHGVKEYLLLKSGASEVIGSDMSAYYIQQAIKREMSDLSLKEQSNILASCRDLFADRLLPHNADRQSVHFIEDDICNSSLPTEYFDLVFSWDCLEHFQNPENAFKHMYRILKPGGFAFHRYNPFFCLRGGHSLCTLDFYWGHIRIDERDFIRYLNEIRPIEKNVAERFYLYNLNRMSLCDLQKYIGESGFETLSIVTWPSEDSLQIVNEQIYAQARRIYPRLTLEDLLSDKIDLVLRKPIQ